MQTVDREGFLGWLNGILLSFENGKGFVAPELHCIAAEEALKRGEKVALTVDGKIMSFLEPNENGSINEVLNDHTKKTN